MAPRSPKPSPEARPPAVVVSRYNGSITGRLLEGALREVERRRGSRADVAVFDAPGAFELPVIAHAAAASGKYSCVVALGCLVRGETSHDRYIAEAVANTLAEASIRTGVPIAFGVLTVDTPEQAEARAGGRKGNKGAEAMAAALDAAAVVAAIGGGAARISRRLPDKARSGGVRPGGGRSKGAAR